MVGDARVGPPVAPAVVAVAEPRPIASGDRSPDDIAGDRAEAPTSSDGPASVGRTVVVDRYLPGASFVGGFLPPLLPRRFRSFERTLA
jgi:hypothetical protein